MKSNLIKEFQKKLDEVKDLENWKQLKAEYTTKSEYLNNLKEELKKATDKKNVGLKIKAYLEEINKLLSFKKNELENSFFLKKEKNLFLFNLKNEIDLPKKVTNIHPLTKLTFFVCDIFKQMNFSYIHGNEIENEKYNFDILNLPKNHPAREKHDTLYLEENELLLRTHVTNMTSRVLESSEKLPVLSYSIGPVFRNDEFDATHSSEFNQIDFFTLNTKTSITNLKYVINFLLKHLFENQKINIRYRTSFFPFTEPSFEVDISCLNCNQKGCNICKDTKWIEILGSGMLHPNVLKYSKIKLEKLSGIAGGIGLERLAMLKWGITDIREFYQNDLNFLRILREVK